MSFESADRDITAFVHSLNREGISLEDMVSAINTKSEGMSDDRLSLFREILYCELWVEPDSLRRRRINGELDKCLAGIWSKYEG